MLLILLRHGKAEDTNPGGDFARELTPRGRKQARRAAKSLAAAGIVPDVVLTSPLVRARQTAEEFCSSAGHPGSLVQGWLACGMRPETALAELAGYTEFQTVVIVGHEPDFSGFACQLTASAPVAIEVKKGALVGFDILPPASCGTLVFLVPPKLTRIQSAD